MGESEKLGYLWIGANKMLEFHSPKSLPHSKWFYLSDDNGI